MLTSVKVLKMQAGVLLIEGLIAILIFSLGILAIVGMQATAVRQASDAKYRSDASLLADQLIGTMWAESVRTSSALKAKFESTGTGYADWLPDVTSTLPNGDATVDVFSDATRPEADGTVTITINWLLPGEPAGTVPHRYVAIAHIK